MSTALMPTDLEIRQKTPYDNFKFKPYEFAEFPMAIPVVNGVIMDSPYNERGKAHPVVIVGSQAELDALRGPGVVLVPVNPDAAVSAQRVAGDDDIRTELYRQADQAGITIDKAWSTERIEHAITTGVAAKAPKAAPRAKQTDVV